jgi:acetoin utilization protein AcuB
MICEHLISNLIPALSTNDTPDKALQIMDEYHLSQLAVLQNEKFIGLVNESDLLDLEVTDKPFSSLNLELVPAAISKDAHVFEALKLMAEFKLSIIPVVTENAKYLGTISSENLLHYLAKGTQYQHEGAVIVVAINEKNYSLSQIARLSESDNITLLSVTSHRDFDNLITLTIKTNKQDVRALVASLERFNYEILEVHSLSDDSVEVHDNFDSLMKFINM